MNIVDIKAAIAAKTGFPLPHLTMVRQMEQDKPEEKTEWLSHWDNDNRVRVVMHQDILESIKANPEMATLAFKYEEVPETTDRAAYKRFVVITPKNIEATF